MSALPNLPPNLGPQEADKRPRRRAGRRWARVFGWIAVGVLAIVALVAISVSVLLRSRSAHDYILRTAQERASQALGGDVRVQDYNLAFSGVSPTLDLYGVVVQGSAAPPAPPLLQVEHIRAGVRVTSLLHRAWYLNDAEVHHPVVHYIIDKNGNDNLPRPKSSGQQSNTDIFDLGVRHAVLDRGEVYYNNRKSVMSADLHDLTFQAGFNTANTTYTGTLGYRNGHLQMENLNPIPHDIQADFELSRDRFTMRQAVLRSGRSQFSLSGTVDDYKNHPNANAQYEALLDGVEFRNILKNASVPAGTIRLAGNLQYASQPNVPLIRAIRLNGYLSSGALAISTPSLTTEIRNIAARYSIAGGDMDVRNLRAEILGGELNGTLTVKDLAGRQDSALHATLKGASLAAAKSVAQSAALRKIDITGTVNANADATWTKSFTNVVAKTDAELQGSIRPAQGGGQAVPLSGVVHANYNGHTQDIKLANSFVRTGQTSLNLNGTVSDRSALQVQLQSADLHELEAIADLFRTPAPGQTTVAPLGLYGRASFNGAVRGSTAAPHLTGVLSAADLRLKGSTWRSVRANIDASPSQASIQNAELIPADRGRIRLSATTRLRKWAFLNTSPLQVSVDASQLNLSQIAKIAGLQTPVTGMLNANLQIHGTELNPIGQGAVTLRQATVSGEQIQSADVRFQGNGDAVHSTLSVKLPAGSANGTLNYFPKQQGYEANLQANGIDLAKVHAIAARNMNIHGVLNINASGRGTLKDPQLTATVQIPELQMQNQRISSLLLRTDVAHHVANFDLTSDVVNSHVRGRGSVNLTGDYEANATIDTDAIPLQPLVAAYAPAQAGNITGQTELHATLRGPLKDRTRLEAHATVPVLSVNLKNAVQIGAPSPIRLDYVNGVLQLQRGALRGTGTDLQFQGSVPLQGSAPLSLLLVGTVDLRLAQLLNPDIASSGQLKFNINSFGQRSDPNVEGQVQIVNANFATGDAPLGLENGNGTMTLTKDRLNIDSFQGTVGGGTLSAKGGVLYRPSLQFDLAVAGKGIRLLYPDNVRTGLDTNLTLTGTTEQAMLRGQVNIDQLSFTPDFDLQTMMGQFGGTTSPPPAQGFSNNLQLDIDVRSTSGINLVGRELSLQGAANLNVRGTAAEPVVLGRVSLTGGDLLFNGNRYVLQGGVIDFVNPSHTEPNLNVAVTTTVQQYNIAMRFEGPVEHMRTSYTSDPALPPADIINLIAFGKTTEEAAANPSPPGVLGAESTIASAVSGQVTSRVGKLMGLSHFSIDPTLGGGRENPGATVTIQQRVTSKVFVTFSTDVTSTQRQVIQLEYQATPRFSVSGTRDQNGGFAVDTRIKKSW